MFTFRCKSLFPGYKESFQRRDTKAKPGPGPCGLHALQQCFHLLLLWLHHATYRLHTYLQLLLLHIAHMLHAAGSETGLRERFVFGGFVFMKQSETKSEEKKRVPEQSRLLLQMR